MQMAAKIKCLPLGFLGPLAIICVSLFIMSHGETLDRNVRSRPSSDTKAYCREKKWFDKHQRKLCYRFPGMIEIIEEGVKNALKECRRQFSSHRWNCSPLEIKQVFTESGILKKRSRETAFVQAITAAGVMMEIARACVLPKTKYCSCGALRRRDQNHLSISHGCGDNLRFGAYLAADFMDPKGAKTHWKKTKRHNQIVGRKIVRQNTQRKCDCDSYLRGCTQKICKRVVPSLEKVGDEIWELYLNPIRSYWNKTKKRLYKKIRIARKVTTSTKQLQGKLVYFKKSENFCEPNDSVGIVGTVGRTCNRASKGPDDCTTLCCGRPYKTSVLFENMKCNCRVEWPCCRIKCEKCMEVRVVDTCR